MTKLWFDLNTQGAMNERFLIGRDQTACTCLGRPCPCPSEQTHVKINHLLYVLVDLSLATARSTQSLHTFLACSIKTRSSLCALILFF